MKRNTLLLAVCLLVAQFGLHAQVNVSGLVIDAENGRPMPGANVRAGTLRTVTTDNTGKFLLRDLPKPVIFLTISYVGYEKAEVPVTEISETRPIALSRSTYVADEVVVQGTRANNRTAMAYTDIDAKDIERQNLGQDLPQLLNFSPSMVTTSDAGAGVGYTGMRIRGSDASGINVTINGIPYNDPESQGTFFVNMPDFASSVSSVQIQRGVGTSTNGAGAFGATVNVNTNTFREKAYAEINNSAGSFNTWKNTVKLGTGLISGKFAVDARLSNVQSDGFVDRGSARLKSYYVSGGYFGEKTFVRANVFSGTEKTYQAWNGVPEARLRNDQEGMNRFIEYNGLNERDAENLLNASSRTYNLYLYDNQTDNYQQDQYQIISTHAFSRYLNLNLNAFYVRGKGFFEEFRDDESLADYRLPEVVLGGDTVTNTDLIRRRWLDNHFYGATFSLDFDNFKKLRLSLGGGWNRYNGDHFGEIIWARFASSSHIRQRYYEGNGLKTDFSLYVKAYYQFTDKLNAYADMQWRSVAHRITGVDNDLRMLDTDRQFGFFNPKAGLTYSIEDHHTLYASYSVGNREPNRSDFVDARPSLQPSPERLNDVEAGWKAQYNRWAFNLNYFLMIYKNQLVLTGEVNDTGSPVRVNVPSSYRTGLELEGALVLGERWKWNANLTLSHSKIRAFSEYVVNYDTGDDEVTYHGKTDISFSPEMVAGSQLIFLPTKVLEIALLSKYVGRQFLDNTATAARSLDAYFTNDLRFTLNISPKWANKLQINVLINNIFNEQYESNGYTYGYVSGGEHVRENFYFPQAGTNFLVGMNLAF